MNIESLGISSLLVLLLLLVDPFLGMILVYLVSLFFSSFKVSLSFSVKHWLEMIGLLYR